MSHLDRTPPEIDYLAKDYASFRRLMLDHLSQLVPDWKEQSQADLGHALVEVLAYAADYLSYYQDAVATEAYLGTARLRRSVRRHVRPLEYYLQEGCNARAWVQVQVTDPKANDKAGVFLPVPTPLLTQLSGVDTSVIRSGDAAYRQALQNGAVTVFETMYPIYLMPHHNQIPIVSMNRDYCLRRGSTQAYLQYPGELIGTSEGLKVGDVLVFEEPRDPQTGFANPDHRHAIRLTKITPGESRAGSWIQIEWSAVDALPFDLRLAPFPIDHPELCPSLALGNIVLVDHGRSIREELPDVQPGVRYRPPLRYPDLTFAAPFDPHLAGKQPAAQVMQYQPYEAFAWIRLRQYAAHFASRRKGSHGPQLLPRVEDVDKDILTIDNVDIEDIMLMHYPWTLRRDLLNSGPFDRDFQVEMEEDRRAYLRFGFEKMGKEPEPGDRFVANYRIGNGSRGNVGADTIHLVVWDENKKNPFPEVRIERVRNPLPARGGCDPEQIQSARLHAPHAFHVPKVCVTPEDYARRLSQHPMVLRALAYARSSGSRRTIVICIQRSGGKPVDEAFRQELCAWIEPYRLMGCDIKIEAPHYVLVRVKLGIDLEPGAPASAVQEGLSKAFGEQVWPDGEVGFFDPARFGFGQPIHQSQVIARAMAVPGVRRVAVARFRRADSDQDVLEIPIASMEIARLQRIDFDFKDGL